MATLHVALQEGFDDDSVVVRVNGRQVYDKAGVSTRMQLGLADSFDASLEPGEAHVEIALPARDMRDNLSVRVDDHLFVGASVENGALRCRVSKEPFGYV